MNIDVSHYIGAINREVQTREHKGRAARVVIASGTYDTSIVDLWDAITNAERIPRWFLPISGDLRLGGRYQLKGNAGGEITHCEAPRRLAVTWEYGGDVTWVDVWLTEEGKDRTRLQLEHIAHVTDERWAQYGPGAVGVGWDMALMGLRLYLSSGAPNDPKEAQAWLASENGKDFARRSSEGWGRASIASGTEEAAVNLAVERTTAAYTGAS